MASKQIQNVWTKGDYLYYDAKLYNSSSNLIPCQYVDSRSGAVIADPENYEVMVKDLYVDASQIPIDNSDGTNYYISIAAGSVHPTWYSAQITWYPIDEAQTDNLYSISQFIYSLNSVLAGLWANNTPSGYTDSVPPVFAWDAATQLITLTQPSYYFTGTHYMMAFSSDFYYKFISTFFAITFGYDQGSHIDVQMIFPSNLTSSNPTYSWDSSSAFNSWSSVQSVFVSTVNLPITPIILPAQTTDIPGAASNFSSPQIFSFINTGQGIQALPGGDLVYTNSQDSTYTSMNPGAPLFIIDFQVYYVLLNGTQGIVQLTPQGVGFSMKLQFRKKKLSKLQQVLKLLGVTK